MIKKIYLLISIAMLYISPAQARWGTHEDAAIEVESGKYDIVINEDGTCEETLEVKEKLLKESARDYAVNYRLNYNSNISTLTILEAKTINTKGEEFKVTQDMIEDKPLASVPGSFDEQRQILVSYPNVEVGASIYIKYKIKIDKVLLDKFFAYTFDFNVDKYYKSFIAKITSKLPLHVKINDPKNSLKVTENNDKKVKYIEITNIKPVYEATIDESRYAVVNPKHLTWVSLSTLDKWEELGNRLSIDYDKVLNQPLPEIFKNISKLAQEKNTDEEIINTVTSQLAEKIQYITDLRTIEGRLIPRALDKIASTQVGDCKDFTISTAAILKKLGFKVAPALVWRGVGHLDSAKLPGEYFNHVMLKVINKSNKVYWVDPTNLASMSDGIFPDIAGKMALVLNATNSSYEKIPNIDPKHGETIVQNTIDVKDSTIVNNVGTITLKGVNATDLVGIGLYYSKQQIEDMIFGMLAGSHLEANKSMTLPDLTSRIVQELTFSYQYEQSNAFFKTNLGLGLPLGYTWHDNILNMVIAASSNQVGDLFIGPASTYKTRTHIKNAKVMKIEALNYEMQTPWVHVKRSCIENNNIVEINDTISILQSFISKENLESTQYKNLKKSLEKDFINSSIIIQPFEK